MSKHIGEPYDPSIRKTEHGASLYQTWRKLRRSPHCEEWSYFPAFYNWAMQNGYTKGAWLRLIESDKPYSADNCGWYIPLKKTKRAGDDSWIDDWNRAANRIRKHFDMPPLEGTSYDDI